MIRIIIKIEQRRAPGAPIITGHQIVEIEAPEVEALIRSEGYGEDGTFEVRQVIGVELPR